MNKAKRYFPIVFFAALTFVVFRDFFLNGLHPYPGNFLLAWFEPFKSDHFANNIITIAHKPLASDIFRQIYPFKVLAADMLKSGQFPLWNPYNGAGMPFLATLNVGLLDPSNVLYLVLPPPLAWTSLIFFPFFLIGIFTYLYCRKINLSKTASMVSSITFLFSGIVTMRSIYSGIYNHTLALLPFIPYLIEDYLKNEKSKKIYILPFALLINIVSGQPQISLYALIFWLLYLIFRIIQIKKTISVKSRKTFLVGIFFLLGLGISAFQLFPSFELFKYANINRASSEFIFKNFLLPANHLVGLVIPNYFGSDATYNFWGAGDTIEAAVYLGAISLFLTILGLLFKQVKRGIDLRFFLLAIIIISILLTLKWPLSDYLYSFSIPIISTGVPSRIFIISTFCMSILAGLGFENLSRKVENSKTKYLLIAFSIFVLLIVIFTSLAYWLNLPCPAPEFVNNCREIALRNTILETIAYSSFISVFFLVTIFKVKTKFLLYSALGIIIIFGLYNTNKFLPFSPISTFYPQNELINVLRNKTLDGRVFGMGEASISTDLATLFRFYDPNYYHPLYIRRYGELVGYANLGKTDMILPRSDIDIIHNATTSLELKMRLQRLFTLLSVKYLIFKKSEITKDTSDVFWENDKWYIKKNQSLSRVYAVNDYTAIKDRKQILTLLFKENFNPYSKVILEEKLSNGNVDKPSNINIDIKRDTGNKLLIQANSSEDSILVLTDNYYPGWHAYIDGQETKIYRANYTFRAIVLPSGKHKVEFRYEPNSFKIGSYISILSFGVLILLFVFIRSKTLVNKPVFN